MSEVKSFIIRPAQEDDLEQIARIEIESAKNEGRLEPLGYTVKDMHKLWKKRLRSGDFDILAAANADNDSHVLACKRIMVSLALFRPSMLILLSTAMA